MDDNRMKTQNRKEASYVAALAQVCDCLYVMTTQRRLRDGGASSSQDQSRKTQQQQRRRRRLEALCLRQCRHTID